MSMNKFSLPLKGLLCLLVCFFSCSKKSSNVDTISDFFPPVQVDFYVNLSLATSLPLQYPNGYIYTSQGYKGIIVYNNGIPSDGNYVAFDRTCPVKTDSACSFVSVDSSGIFYRCGQYKPSFVPCCNSKFYASNGTPASGDARRALKQYYTRLDGNLLHVSSTPLQ